ncbi:MAG TPA: hypothetical protein VJI13_01265 [Candidatus Norongarragalinales archaeon]|nr:hypothetical protein [Candidatus Norongarragalinales archaeon]
MWILTKFALLFFIIGLFSIIFMFEQRARANTCDMQVQRIADSIAGRLAQILDSPVEDEQRSFPFEIGLQLGQNDVGRYYVNITDRQIRGTTKGIILVDVAPSNVRNCQGFAKVDYSDKNVTLDSIRTYQKTLSRYEDRIIQLNPSDLDDAKRTYYLTMIKCSEKVYQGRKYLYIQDCNQKDFKACWSFDEVGSVIDQTCGFNT